MRFAEYRLFLNTKDQHGLLDTEETRGEYLRRVFGSDVRFEHYGRLYVYKFQMIADNRFAIGLVGSEVGAIVEGSPDENYAPQEIHYWRTATIIVDSDDSPTGQYLFYSVTGVSGLGISLLRSLADHINEANPNSRYVMSVNAVVSTDVFWSVVQANAGKISELRISLLPPNIFKQKRLTDEALRETHSIDGTDQLDVVFKNRNGLLTPKSDRIKETVDYAAEGGGKLALKRGKKVIYNSEQKAKVKETDNIKVQQADEQTILGAIRKLIPWKKSSGSQ